MILVILVVILVTGNYGGYGKPTSSEKESIKTVKQEEIVRENNDDKNTVESATKRFGLGSNGYDVDCSCTGLNWTPCAHRTGHANVHLAVNRVHHGCGCGRYNYGGGCGHHGFHFDDDLLRQCEERYRQRHHTGFYPNLNVAHHNNYAVHIAPYHHEPVRTHCSCHCPYRLVNLHRPVHISAVQPVAHVETIHQQPALIETAPRHPATVVVQQHHVKDLRPVHHVHRVHHIINHYHPVYHRCNSFVPAGARLPAVTGAPIHVRTPACGCRQPSSVHLVFQPTMRNLTSCYYDD